MTEPISPAVNPRTRDLLSGQAVEALKDITFGSVAGIVGKFVEYPFDTIKVRLQSQPDGHPLRYTGPLDCFKQSVRQDGFLGLYRGISAPLVGAAVENSSLFFSYRLAQDALRATVLPPQEPLSLTALIFCGSVSGAVTSLLLTPIELIKCKMQVPVGSPHAQAARLRPLALIASIYRHEGLLQFWHGQLGTLIRETGGSAAWFGGYEGMKLAFQKLRSDTTTNEQPLPIYQQMISGAVAGISYNFLFFPADTVKSCMQTEEVGGMVSGKRTFWAVSRALWSHYGVAGFYRGCGITVLRSAPASALIFTVYEALRKHVGQSPWLP